VGLLAGRAAVRTMHPFMAAELPALDLEASLQTGTLPLVVHATDPADTLGAYAGLYVHQEVLAEGLVRQTGAFARFLGAASFSHGAVLNISNVAREAAVGRKLVEGYLDELDELLVACRLPVFTRRA
jgi:hypothetical protein